MTLAPTISAKRTRRAQSDGLRLTRPIRITGFFAPMRRSTTRLTVSGAAWAAAASANRLTSGMLTGFCSRVSCRPASRQM